MKNSVNTPFQSGRAEEGYPPGLKWRGGRSLTKGIIYVVLI